MQREQGVQADDLPHPNLDLSTYLQGNPDNEVEDDKSGISVDIALQTGDSLRYSRKSPETHLNEQSSSLLDFQNLKEAPDRETIGNVSITSEKMRNVFGCHHNEQNNAVVDQARATEPESQLSFANEKSFLVESPQTQ